MSSAKTMATLEQKLDVALWWKQMRETNNAHFLPLLFDKHRFLVLKGGGGSGKSIFAGRKILERVTNEPGHRYLVVRKVAKTLRESCFEQLKKQAYEYYADQIAFIPKGKGSDMYIRFKNGSEILFAGLDDVEKLKSIFDITGIWIEEASELEEGDFNQLDIRLRTEFPFYLQMILTFNPISITHWLKKRFFDTKDPRATVHESTYKDNRFLTPEARITLEAFRETDEYPVHEVLVPSDGRPFFRCVNVEGMAAEHLPDERKSRAQYLPLLELAAQETPQDARCAHYLGREYLYRGMFRKAAEELKRHLTLPSAVWDEERAASMRYLSACMHALGDERSAMCWAMRAIAEVPEQRENWYEAEKAAYRAENWEGVVYYGRKALRITTKSRSTINEAEAWGAAPWDLLSIGLWHTGDIRGAAEAASTALSLCRSERIEANLRLFQERLGEA